MKPYQFILPLLLLFAVNAFGQVKISGVITDASSENLPGATILLKDTINNQLIKTAVSNEVGAFELPSIAAGEYLLETRYVGYKNFEGLVTVSTEDVSINPIALQLADESIEQVEVVAERPMVEVQADKTIFNVQKTINATGSNGWELLRKAPGVFIDNNNNIVVEGKTGIQIQINGKRQYLEGDDLKAFLESLTASDVDSFEIITNPGSEYDAEGTAGIINIQLTRSDRYGWNVNLSSNVTQGERLRGNNSVTINQQSGKGQLRASYSNNLGESTGFLDLRRFQNNFVIDGNTDSYREQKSHTARVSYDYFLSDKHTLGAVVNYNSPDSESGSTSNTPISNFGSMVIDSILVAESSAFSDRDTWTTNLFYNFKDTLGNDFTIEGDLTTFDSFRSNLQPNSYVNASRSEVFSSTTAKQDSPSEINIYSVRADYKRKLWGGNVSIGAKRSTIKSDNEFYSYDLVNSGQFQLNDNQSNQFLYDENITAGYINYGKSGQKWSYKMGLRVENTDTEGRLVSLQQVEDNNVKRNYTNLFPSGGVTYNLNRTNKFALNYSRRIRRPNYASLNPFVFQNNELEFYKGNPFLQPQYTNSFKLTHTYKYVLNTALSYAKVSDFFANISQPQGEKSNFLSQENVSDQDVWNLSVSFPHEVNDFWSLYFSGTGSATSFDSNDPNYQPIDAESFSFYMQNSLKFTDTFTGEISGWFSTPSIWGGTYETKSIGSLNAAVEKKLLNNAMNIKLAGNDLLFTSPWRADSRYGGLFIEGTGGNDSRNVTLSVNYKFGNQKMKNKRDRKGGAEDELKRLN